jgi:hypothetical protein
MRHTEFQPHFGRHLLNYYFLFHSFFNYELCTYLFYRYRKMVQQSYSQLIAGRLIQPVVKMRDKLVAPFTLIASESNRRSFGVLHQRHQQG